MVATPRPARSRACAALPPRSAWRSSDNDAALFVCDRRCLYGSAFRRQSPGGGPGRQPLDRPPGGEMQWLAAEFNLSETTFVLPPQDAANTARVRIFARTSEMPFAGHPNVGTGWELAGLGRDRAGLLRFEELAGLVEVRVECA